MAYFLLKTEPSEYSFDDLLKDGKTTWEGVANNLALKNIRTMRPGDSCLIYHSGDEKAVIGIARIVSSPYSDPKRKDGKLVVVDLEPVERLSRAVTLSELKSVRSLQKFELIRIPRLSVMPVPANVWDTILKISRED